MTEKEMWERAESEARMQAKWNAICVKIDMEEKQQADASKDKPQNSGVAGV